MSNLFPMAINKGYNINVTNLFLMSRAINYRLTKNTDYRKMLPTDFLCPVWLQLQ